MREETVQGGEGYVDPVKERHIKDLEGLVNEHRMHMRSVETEVQQLVKRPALDEGSGLQVLREELVNESRQRSVKRYTVPSSFRFVIVE